MSIYANFSKFSIELGCSDYIDLIFENMNTIPTDRLSELANHSLLSISASSTPLISYGAIHKFDAKNLGGQIEDSVRSQIYAQLLNHLEGNIERYKRTLNERRTKMQPYERENRNLEAELGILAAFVEAGGSQLSAQHLSLALSTYLSANSLPYARVVLQQAQG